MVCKTDTKIILKNKILTYKSDIDFEIKNKIKNIKK